jgi:hypothetical protein
VELWRSSLDLIEARHPGTLFLTHFGPSSPPGPHLVELRDHLDLVARLVQESLLRDEDDQAREEWFADRVRGELRRMSESEARGYEVAARFDLSWRGLARYFRKR